MPKATQTYQQMEKELSEIVEWFESGEFDLDEAVAKYEAANELIAKMQAYLKNAENKIKKISANFE